MNKDIMAADFGLLEDENDEPGINHSPDTTINIPCIKRIGWCNIEIIGISIVNTRALATFGKI